MAVPGRTPSSDSAPSRAKAQPLLPREALVLLVVSSPLLTLLLQVSSRKLWGSPAPLLGLEAMLLADVPEPILKWSDVRRRARRAERAEAEVAPRAITERRPR